jgi:hypothetical protein
MRGYKVSGRHLRRVDWRRTKLVGNALRNAT